MQATEPANERVVPASRSNAEHTVGPTTSRRPDPLVLAVARYVEALHERYPDGPIQMRQEALAARAKITRMSDARKGRIR
jgi:hypothetical protein